MVITGTTIADGVVTMLSYATSTFGTFLPFVLLIGGIGLGLWVFSKLRRSLKGR